MTTFISYSRANSNFAVRLAKDLKAAGFDIWLDQLDIPTGARWDDEIEKALEKSKSFLIILSPESIESQNVKDEVGFAIDSGKHILPVITQPCKIPFRLRRFQYVDFSVKSYEENFTEIQKILRTPPPNAGDSTLIQYKSLKEFKNSQVRQSQSTSRRQLLIFSGIGGFFTLGALCIVVTVWVLPNLPLRFFPVPGPIKKVVTVTATQKSHPPIAVTTVSPPKPIDMTITPSRMPTITATVTKIKSVIIIKTTAAPIINNGVASLNWTTIGGIIKDNPAVSSWATDRMDVFVRGMDDHLWHQAWDGTRWSEFRDVGNGGLLASAPTAVSWGPNRIDIFARGLDDHVWHYWWDGAWGQWQDLGGQIKDAPAVASWGADRLDVFARGMDDHLWHMAWNGSGWSNWEDISNGGIIASAPSVVSWGPNRIDIVARGADAHVWHYWWDGAWGQWQDLQGLIKDAPSISSYAPNRLDVFVRGMDDLPWYTTWDGSTWSAWQPFGSATTTSSPAAVSFGRNRVGLFIRSQNQDVLYTVLNK